MKKKHAGVEIRLFRGGWLLLLAGLLAGMIVLAAGLGQMAVPWTDVARVIFAKTFGHPSLFEGVGEVAAAIVWDVRLPRILTSAIVGAGLAVSGTVFQGLLLNPLADPYTLGVSSGAAFGASLALILNIGFMGTYSVPLFAFMGAELTLGFVLFLSSPRQTTAHNLILSGIIVTAILSAGISFLKYIADEQVSVIIFWLMGSFASKTWSDVGITALVLAAGLAVCQYCARDLNLMALGGRSAGALGVNVKRTSRVLLLSASCIAAVCVSVSGIIGFVGLLVPHMMREISGPDNRILIPFSMFAGGILLLAGDTVTRAILPREIPIGVLTALIGGPFFCYIFRRRQTRGKF